MNDTCLHCDFVLKLDDCDVSVGVVGRFHVRYVQHDWRVEGVDLDVHTARQSLVEETVARHETAETQVVGAEEWHLLALEASECWLPRAVRSKASIQS